MRAVGIRSRLVVVWLLFAALVGVIAVIQHRELFGPGSGHTTDADPRWLLPLPVDQLGAIEVASAGRLHRFERDPAGAWFYHGVHRGSEGAHTHIADPSVAQHIGRALAAFGRTRIERHLTGDPQTYGVTTPQLLVLVYPPQASQPLAQYAIGDVAPDTLSRYVHAVGRPGVVTIPSYQIDNLLALIEAVAASSGQEPATGSALLRPGAPAGAERPDGLARPDQAGRPGER